MSDYLATKSVFKRVSFLNGQSGTREPKYSEIDILKTQVWLGSLLLRNDLSLKDLSQIYYGRREPTGTIRNWSEGKHIANRASVERIERHFRGSSAVFDLPVFDLLNRTISKRTLTQLFEQYTKNHIGKTWNFPIDSFFHKEKYEQFIYRDNSKALLNFGGVFGFIGILMLLREAELNKDATTHFLLLQDAYRALPGFCRHRYFRDHWEKFFESFYSIHFNMYLSAMFLLPKIDIIEKQIFSDPNITSKQLRPQFSSGGCFDEPELPYEIAGFEKR